MKKVFGYIFIALSIILALAIVGQASQLMADVIAFVKAISGQLDAYNSGKIIGKFTYIILHLTITICLWLVGRRWTKKPVQ